MKSRAPWAAVLALGLATVAVALLREAGALEPRATCGAHRDFLVRSDPTLAPVRPADCSTVTQSPPELTWPPLDGNYTYTVTLAFPDGHSESRTTLRNWLAWDHALPPGRYSWRVKSSHDSDVSDPRLFTIAPDPVTFVLPPPDEIVKRARAAPHPRTWVQGAASPIAAARAERSHGFQALAREVDDKLNVPVQAEPAAQSDDSNYEDTVSEQKRTLAAAFAWAVTHDARYGSEAARRLLAQAGWSVTGPISFARNDMASRNVAWTLALGYDWAYDALTPAQRRTLLAAIRVRMRDMFEEYVASGKIARYPYDSHGNLSLTLTAAIAALTAGDLPESDDWLRAAAPMAAVWTSPWGGADGGFGNGTAQAQWDTGSNLVAWYVLRNAAGIDLAKKDWVRHYARYLAYFLPPGTPSGLFGDGQEMKLSEVWARVGKAYTAFAPSPLGLWYAAQLRGEDDSRLELLLAPRLETHEAAFPAGTPNAAVFPSIGWAAMHSDLRDPRRTSVYFKSSPYGSYNHEHADQNSFVVNDQGEPLLIASGYYDNYRTPHWTDWYKQTRAANAITFDAGRGQGIDGRQFAGEIARFETHGGYDVVAGRAEAAYGGALAKAVRTLVYVRPGIVVVRDELSADKVHVWEWNFHAMHRMTAVSPRRVSIANGAARACVEWVSGPAASFTQDDRFTAQPEKSSMIGEIPPREWHGRFVASTPSPSADIVVVIRVGSDCSGAPATASPTAHGVDVAIDGRTVSLLPDGAEVH